MDSMLLLYQRNWIFFGYDVISDVQSFFLMVFFNKTGTQLLLWSLPLGLPVLWRTIEPMLAGMWHKSTWHFVSKNRLQLILPLIINHSQSVSIKGRAMADNVLMHKLVSIIIEMSLLLAIKIDLMKPPIRLTGILCGKSWLLRSFLLNTLVGSGHVCLLHGSLWWLIGTWKVFSKGKSIPQGDPISPCLFLIVMEGYFCNLAG